MLHSNVEPLYVDNSISVILHYDNRIEAYCMPHTTLQHQVDGVNSPSDTRKTATRLTLFADGAKTTSVLPRELVAQCNQSQSGHDGIE